MRAGEASHHFARICTTEGLLSRLSSPSFRTLPRPTPALHVSTAQFAADFASANFSKILIVLLAQRLQN